MKTPCDTLWRNASAENSAGRSQSANEKRCRVRAAWEPALSFGLFQHRFSACQLESAADTCQQIRDCTEE